MTGLGASLILAAAAAAAATGAQDGAGTRADLPMLELRQAQDLDCRTPAAARPPDPRCREGLDGRPPPGPPPLTPGRLLLRGPQLLSRALFWPVVQGSALLESYRILDWMTALLTSDDGRLGVRPELHYASNFLPTGGARLFYRPPAADLLLRAHSGGPSTWRAEITLRAPTGSDAASGGHLGAAWERRPDRLYAGLGAQSEAALAARGEGLGRYGAEMLTARLGWAHRLGQRLSLGAEGDLVRRSFQASAVRGTPLTTYFDPATIPGFQAGDRLAHLGGGLALRLGSAQRDGSGLRFAGRGTYAEGLATDLSRHLRLEGETVASLGRFDRTLLLRLQAAMVEPLGDAAVPFEELVSPAGSAGLRGAPEGRFRGPSAAVATLEYRWFAAFNLDAALFVDIGTVAGERFSGLTSARLFPGVGLGLRRYGGTSPAYWGAAVEDGLQIVYAPEGGWRLLLSTAAF